MKILTLKSSQQMLSTQALKQVVTTLNGGGLVIFPTETVYGAGVDATNLQAVQKLLKYKSRREGKPLSIAVTDQRMAEKYVELNDQARSLYQQFLPGPVTVISKSLGQVAPGVASEFDTLGVRLPDFPLVTKIVAALGRPITATSANASGKRRPYTIEHILDNISAKQRSLIDLIIDVGQLPRNDPSTVIDTTLSTPVTVRAGSVTLPAANNQTQLDSSSPQETKEIAGKLLLKYWNRVTETGLIVGLTGPLGVGKTVFAQGVASFLGIQEAITSPTYGYHEEYSYQRHQTQGQLHHLDLWKIDSAAVAHRLKLETLLKPGNIILIEWWNNVGDYIFDLARANQMPFLTLAISENEESSEVSNHRIIDVQEVSCA